MGDDLSEDVTLTQITSEQARARAASAPVDRISALAAKHADGAMLLDIPADSSHPSRSCWILLESDANPSPTWGHPGAHRRGCRSEGDRGAAVLGAAQYAGNLSVVVGDNASLELVVCRTGATTPCMPGISPPGSAAMPACAASW